MEVIQSISPIRIWKLTGSRLGLFWAWNKQYSSYSWIDFPKGKESPSPAEPSTYGLRISFSRVSPACPYMKGMMPIPPKKG